MKNKKKLRIFENSEGLNPLDVAHLHSNVGCKQKSFTFCFN